uniref:Uncharacterized protein n=1 Tax=Hyaloperonospora arabidopsidis (strain Emoy2) TaxID=559515 RepID=M4B4C8_HYAAE
MTDDCNTRRVAVEEFKNQFWKMETKTLSTIINARACEADGHDAFCPDGKLSFMLHGLTPFCNAKKKRYLLRICFTFPCTRRFLTAPFDQFCNSTAKKL